MAPKKQHPKAAPKRQSIAKGKKSLPRQSQGSPSKSPSTSSPSKKQRGHPKATPRRQSPRSSTPKAIKSTPQQLRRSLSKALSTSGSKISGSSSSSSISIPPNMKNELRIAGKMRLISDKVLMEIHNLQLSVKDLIPKLSFSRLVREVMQQHGQFQLQSLALEGLQCAVEMYLTQLFEDTNRCAAHAHRITIKPIDMNLVLELTSRLDPK